jgi:hypothetical protein
MGDTTFFNEMAYRAARIPTPAIPPKTTEPSTHTKKFSPDSSEVFFIRYASQASKMLWFIPRQQHSIDCTTATHCTRLHVPIISGDK